MLCDLTEKHIDESKKILSFTKQEVKEESQVRESRLPVGMFSAMPANLHRWHIHTDEVDVKMDALFYTKALQTRAAFPVRAGAGKAHLSLSRLG